MGERSLIEDKSDMFLIETEREIMPRCVHQALSPIPKWMLTGFVDMMESFPGDARLRLQGFRVRCISIYRFVRALECLLSLYRFTYNRLDILSAFYSLMSAEIEALGSIKSRLNRYSSMSFPQDTPVNGTYWRICSGRIGRDFRCVSRRIRLTSSLDERAAYALSVAKLSHALIPGDPLSISVARDKLVQRVAPERSDDIESELMSYVSRVVKEVYPRRSFKEPSLRDMCPNNSSTNYDRKIGMSYGLVKDTYGYLAVPEMCMMFPDLVVKNGRRVHRQADLLYPSQLDLIADFPLPTQHGVSVMHLPVKGKVRTVTKSSDYDNLNIYRVQGSFFRPIWNYPSFKYTCVDVRDDASHFERLNRIGGELVPPMMLYISGDFEECTDRFSSEWTKYTIEQICYRIGVPIQFWKELLDSVVEWAFDGPIPSGFLGQPQGHGLSFPVLCVINAALYRMAFDIWSKTCPFMKRYRGLALKDLPVMINGDDIVFRGDRRLFIIWRDLAQKLGIKVSEPKTYLSETHFTMNSRSFNGITMKHCDHVMSYLAVPNFPLSVWSYSHEQKSFSPVNHGETRESHKEVFERIRCLYRGVSFRRPIDAMYFEDRVIRNLGFSRDSFIHPYAHYTFGGLGIPLLEGRIHHQHEDKFRISGFTKSGWSQVQFGFLMGIIQGPRMLKKLLTNDAPGTRLSPVERVINGIYGKVWEKREFDPFNKVLDITEPFSMIRNSTWNVNVPRVGNLTKSLFDCFFKSIPRKVHNLVKKPRFSSKYLEPRDLVIQEEEPIAPRWVAPRIW